jgi:ankyrin repeat protein
MGPFLKCVELLIHYGAEVNETNERLVQLDDQITPSAQLSATFFNPAGCTPLMLACAFDQDGYVVRELILNAHARADLTDQNGYNTLHYAAFQGNINVFEIVS